MVEGGYWEPNRLGLAHGGIPRVPPSTRTGWGTPPPPIRQSSIASTCYAAGGMPLAFTQEDFLVTNFFWKITFQNKQSRKNIDES